jgi:hypothetical protein
LDNEEICIGETDMELLDLLAKQWSVIAQAPLPFVTVSVAMWGAAYAVAVWYHKRQIENLISDNETLEKKHTAEVHILERRIESLDEDNARLRLLHEEKTRRAFVQVIEAPNHRIDYPIPIKRLLAEQPEYRILEKHNLLKLYGDANHTSVSSTSAATQLWDDITEEASQRALKILQTQYKKKGD